jgi:hypothetical protein
MSRRFAARDLKPGMRLLPSREKVIKVEQKDGRVRVTIRPPLPEDLVVEVNPEHQVMVR